MAKAAVANSAPPVPRIGWRGWLTMCIYQPVFLLAMLVYLPLLCWRSLFRRRQRQGFAERLGFLPRAGWSRPVVWIHGVSVGEVKAASNFIAQLQRARPDLQLVVSATTPNGHLVARQEYPHLPVVFYPLDLLGCPRRALRRVRPRCVLLMELEIWPNFLQAARRRGIPVAVINGRISERTFRGYRLARGLLPQLDLLSIYCVQDRVYQQRLVDLGVAASRVHVTGNMKYDSVVMGTHAEAAALLRPWLAPQDELVLVAGSTHADEELWLLLALRQAQAGLQRAVRLVLVPRHPERSPAIAEQLAAAGAKVRLWTDCHQTLPALAADEVVLVDTIGQLQRFYAACDLAFVGGSLIPHGGQNMLEPAAQGKATLFGPHTSNFRRDVELLLAADAARQIGGRDELPMALQELLAQPERRAALGAQALAVIAANQGATARTLELVADLLGAPPPAATAAPC